MKTWAVSTAYKELEYHEIHGYRCHYCKQPIETKPLVQQIGTLEFCTNPACKTILSLRGITTGVPRYNWEAIG